MGSYVYRRELTRDELLPALGLGLGLGLGVAVATAYVTQIFLRRTPLRRSEESQLGHPRESGTRPDAFHRHPSESGKRPAAARGDARAGEGGRGR